MTEQEKQDPIAALKKDVERFTKIAWICMGLGVLAAVVGLYVFAFNKSNMDWLSQLSLLGSYFQGAVGSLWSLAAFLFIYVSFLGQKLQLIQQEKITNEQKEQFNLQLTRQDDELKAQNEQFKLQQDSIQRQNFESTFFQLLGFYSQITNQLEVRYRESGIHGLTDCQVNGKLCFGKLYECYKHDVTTRTSPSSAQLQDRNFVVQDYCKMYEANQELLGHYFRTLYHVFKYINDSQLSPEEKRRYSSLVRAQLSAFELFFLFYNCLSLYGAKFKPLVEEFGLLEHLAKKFLFHPSHVNFYSEKAYG